MGIHKEVAAFVDALALPPGFSVCELGDQGMCGTGKHHPARPWYEGLGCGRYVSIDGNGRGTVTHDLNLPLDGHVGDPTFEPFDLVTDFGTGEHIFDQAQVWRTIHALTTPGGVIAFDRPAQGYPTHCYYLTDECLYRDLAEANGYTTLWLAQAQTPRGVLIRGAYRRPPTHAAFVVPQQGRYRSSLVI